MSKYGLRNIAIAVKETWYVPTIATIMVLMALAGTEVLETYRYNIKDTVQNSSNIKDTVQNSSNIKDTVQNSKNNLKPRPKAFEAFAESYELDVNGIADTATINPSFEEK